MKRVRGDESRTVAKLSAPQDADGESLIFVSDRAHLQAALDSPARAWVIKTDLAEKVPAHVDLLITSDNVQLAMALTAKKFFPITFNQKIRNGQAIDPAAIIATSAQIGSDCIIGPGAVIGDDCVIENGCTIGANCVIEPRVRIGSGTRLHPLVFIGHSCELGKNCEFHPNTTIGS
jgi:UDP-3-O-[3-hydroxymyristoyl] glucosamine N-acyltransferase